MRLSDTQYKALVRIGIVTVIAAVFAFDQTPRIYQPIILLVAAIGSSIGFFPLATSLPFQPEEEDEHGQEQPQHAMHTSTESQEMAEMLTHFNFTTAAATKDYPYSEAYERKLSLESYIQEFYSQLNMNQQANRLYLNFFRAISADVPNLGLTNRLLQAVQIERAARVKEVHDLVDKLKGTPQTFSVELTSSDSIVIHCEGRSRSSLILDDYEKDLLNYDEPRDETTGIII